MEKTGDELSKTEHSLRALTTKHNDTVLRTTKDIEDLREKCAEQEDDNAALSQVSVS